jgi:hypothetical protein
MSANVANPEPTLEQVRAAKRHALGAFKRLGKVTGVGITRIGNGYGLKINLEEAPGDKVALPATIKGIPVLVEVVGPLRKRLVA